VNIAIINPVNARRNGKMARGCMRIFTDLEVSCPFKKLFGHVQTIE